MRKVISVLTMILVCAALVCPVLADSEFVPSISYKGTPDVVSIQDAAGNEATAVVRDETGAAIGYMYDACTNLTPVASAADDSEIPAEAKAELLKVYAALEDGSMKLPYGDDVDADKMVIRDLFDVTWKCNHDHTIALAPAGVTVEMTFDVGVDKDAKVVVMTYKNNAWNEIAKVVNNGDGTITCTFESLCPVAISVESEDAGNSKDTGDAIGKNMHMWIALMAVSAVAVVSLVVVRRKVQ